MISIPKERELCYSMRQKKYLSVVDTVPMIQMYPELGTEMNSTCLLRAHS